MMNIFVVVVFQNFSMVVADPFCFQVATDYWLKKGVDGILLYGVEHVAQAAPSVWTNIRETVSNHSKEMKK